MSCYGEMKNKDEKKIRFGGWNHPPYRFVRRKLLKIAFESEYGDIGVLVAQFPVKEAE